MPFPSERRRTILQIPKQDIERIYNQADFQDLLCEERKRRLYMIEEVGLTPEELDAYVAQIVWYTVAKMLWESQKVGDAQIASDVTWAYWWTDDYAPAFLSANQKVTTYNLSHIKK